MIRLLNLKSMCLKKITKKTTKQNKEKNNNNTKQSVIRNFDKETLLSLLINLYTQFVTFKPLSYCFKETIGIDVNASFASSP